jgi:hypothetical protein
VALVGVRPLDARLAFLEELVEQREVPDVVVRAAAVRGRGRARGRAIAVVQPRPIVVPNLPPC